MNKITNTNLIYLHPSDGCGMWHLVTVEKQIGRTDGEVCGNALILEPKKVVLLEELL